MFNIACGDRITVSEMLEQINRIAGKTIAPIHKDPRAGDIKHSQADIQKAQTMMGYKPSVTFAEGLQLTVDWYARQLAAA